MLSSVIVCFLKKVRKSDGKRSLGRPRRRWEDNFKIIFLNKMERHVLNWLGSGNGQASDYSRSGNEHSGSIKCG
jgi:hypothetical protein